MKKLWIVISVLVIVVSFFSCKKPPATAPDTSPTIVIKTPNGINTFTSTLTATITQTSTVTPTVTMTVTLTPVVTPVGGNYVWITGDGVNPDLTVNVQINSTVSGWSAYDLILPAMIGVDYLTPTDQTCITVNPPLPPCHYPPCTATLPTAWVQVDFYKGGTGVVVGTTKTANVVNYCFDNTTF